VGDLAYNDNFKKVYIQEGLNIQSFMNYYRCCEVTRDKDVEKTILFYLLQKVLMTINKIRAIEDLNRVNRILCV
jgi:hypothetical protein